MGGGQGTRLFPLTKERAKPAVPLAGKYRLVDIPISNCINSGLRRIYLLTQFNSASLHRHISQSYKFDQFSGGFVEILAAEQTFADTSWYQGTADAVRKNLIHFLNHDFDYLLILSGDQLYRMDFRRIIDAAHRDRRRHHHRHHPGRPARGAVAGHHADRRRAAHHAVRGEAEGPGGAGFAAAAAANGMPRWESRAEGELFLASMGIYVFNRDVIRRLLDNTLTDFGKHIIPNAIKNHRVFSYVFQGYWEDIGTIRAFFEANLDLTSELPRFNFFDMTAPIFSRPRFLPGSKINGAQIDHAVISDGCIINRAVITHSIVGLRSIVGDGTDLNRVILLGSDYYESLESIQRARESRQAAHRHRRQLPHREHHHRQERAHRQQRGHLARRQARECGPSDLLHPRRHRHHPQERRHPARHGDLSPDPPASWPAPGSPTAPASVRRSQPACGS